ncbi:hypothetical protein [Paenibacillus apis]|uniref:CN hydrolase domain-containing protein n=1 Tax=Paenibacillus apis TaxID=1792174 RepID=A0A919Y3K6_9BACL|nr:hypothetical protein [Paenibacillus apis]GIO41703.1 hypothetical protein J41TS4_14610 [Paenibacillus apis]
MKILIGLPKLENQNRQLEEVLRGEPEVDLVLFPEGYLNEDLKLASTLMRSCGTMLVSGYRKPKDRLVIIGRNGEVVLDRAKYEQHGSVELEGVRMTSLLCDELVKQGLIGDGHTLDLIFHPIGVGMFSEEQFSEWIGLAKNIAKQHGAIMIGTSHADGAYRDSEISIPIAYCINQNGEEIFVKKNDVRMVILDTNTGSFHEYALVEGA